ncbi:MULTISPECIES: hypothetical protein [unclassified Streptomyces]|uniref:hypothetical protein n=1 Tax=unclassified Streptomyces TaxID=2593676 RepID=UPI002E2CD7AE|nr:hypothetical protein [Streptomyces sp. NBC_01429]
MSDKKTDTITKPQDDSHVTGGSEATTAKTQGDSHVTDAPTATPEDSHVTGNPA